jgi:uncharacterized membrane protein
MSLATMQRPEWFISGAEGVATAIEGIGILIVLFGGLLALAGYARDALRMPEGSSYEAAYRDLRRRLGRAILLGLEFLVAADIIGTVLVSPTLANAAALGVVVLIRTFLSWSLELEIDGRWPWQKNSPPQTPT